MIIKICGSHLYTSIIEQKTREFTSQGHSVFVQHTTNPSNPMTETVRHARYFNEIEAADMVYIVNKDGYIGETVTAELAYAAMLKKQIEFYDTDVWKMLEFEEEDYTDIYPSENKGESDDNNNMQQP